MPWFRTSNAEVLTFPVAYCIVSAVRGLDTSGKHVKILFTSSFGWVLPGEFTFTFDFVTAGKKITAVKLTKKCNKITSYQQFYDHVC